ADRHLLSELADQLVGLRVAEQARGLDRRDAGSAAEHTRRGPLHTGVVGADLTGFFSLVDLLHPFVAKAKRDLLADAVGTTAVGLERCDAAGLGTEADLEELVAEHVFFDERHLRRPRLRRGLSVRQNGQPDEAAGRKFDDVLVQALVPMSANES